MIDELKHNIQTELEIVRELAMFVQQREIALPQEKHLLEAIISSLRERLKLLNNSTGPLIRAVSLAQPLSGKEIPTGIERLHFKSSNQRVALQSRDKENYLKELSIS